MAWQRQLISVQYSNLLLYFPKIFLLVGLWLCWLLLLIVGCCGCDCDEVGIIVLTGLLSCSLCCCCSTQNFGSVGCSLRLTVQFLQIFGSVSCILVMTLSFDDCRSSCPSRLTSPRLTCFIQKRHTCDISNKSDLML